MATEEKTAKPKKTSSSKKFYYVMLGGFLLSIALIVGAVVMGNSMLKKRSQELLSLKLENQLLDEQQTALTKAQKDIENYKDFDKISKTIVPQDKDQARAVREIVDIARESGIAIENITFPASNLGGASAAPAAGATGTASKAPPISQAKPVEGISGLYSLQIDIKPSGNLIGGEVTYYQFLDFLERLEKNRRTSQVVSFRITPIGQSSSNPTIDFNLSINLFLKP